MKVYRVSLIVLVGLLVAGAVAFAQTPGATAQQGFTVETLISQLSLYLPEEATQGMLGGFGRGGAPGGGAGATGAASGAGTGTTAQGAARQGFAQAFQFTRDAKLYLTKDQINKLLPIFTGLKDNPMPTPSKAKTIQASVDAILTAAQKAEYAAYQKQMEKAIADMRKQFAASGASGAPGATGAGGFPGGADQAGQARTGQGGGAAQMTPLERRQREVDAFIKVLQDRLKLA